MLVNVPPPPPPPAQQASPSTVLAPSPPPQPESVSVVVNSGSFPVVNVTNVRTFTSTEAQTDDFGDVAGPGAAPAVPALPQPPPPRVPPPAPAPAAGHTNREQRRRERRERRQQRRLGAASGAVPPPLADGPPPPPGDRLPDLLHSHLPPPYSTLPLPPQQPPPPPHHPPPPPAVSGMRFPFQISPAGARRWQAGRYLLGPSLCRHANISVRSRRAPRGQHYSPEEEPKSCCGVVVTQTVSIRWFIVMIAFVGVCCAVVGTVLGAMKASGREHLTVSLLMIGVGVVLITVSGVAWRLTAHDAPSCRSMLGLAGGDSAGAEPNRRFVPRLPPSYGRPHHPYAAMMYPEFQYRPPPPSYQASMQEYRLRLLLLDRQPQGHNAVSPPPTYRSHVSSTFRAPLGLRREAASAADYSRPPSYRSRTSSTRPTLDPGGGGGGGGGGGSLVGGGGGALAHVDHSRDPSLSLSESADSGKLRFVLDPAAPGGKDLANLVTIVQTDDSPVIVTVSGSTPIVTGSSPPGQGGHSGGSGINTEMEILAHL
ncbi:uncharacterized protein LOC126335558 isoform X1 [Schistocerca gregaria]|uniref:uncharacterized protein LOC126335558 isoform X1 n=1 Tax=Schistocerca gregaria TaxID=7010 RepID=UPI00211E29D6|nr:uncharacterized protein LOC126335558 isoform X1 [Schistocerca gregaria]